MTWRGPFDLLGLDPFLLEQVLTKVVVAFTFFNHVSYITGQWAELSSSSTDLSHSKRAYPSEPENTCLYKWTFSSKRLSEEAIL